MKKQPVQKPIVGMGVGYPVESNVGYVGLDDLEGNENFIGSTYSIELRSSIYKFGVISPIIISSTTDEDGKYRVIDGKRRVRILRDLKKKPKILARMLVIDGKDVDHSLLYAMLEATSSANEASMVDHVMRLYASGMKEYQIHAHTGVSRAKIRNYLFMAFNLDGDLMVAFQEGRIPYAVANRASKCPPCVQLRLFEYLQEAGSIGLGKIRKTVEAHQKSEA